MHQKQPPANVALAWPAGSAAWTSDGESRAKASRSGATVTVFVRCHETAVVSSGRPSPVLPEHFGERRIARRDHPSHVAGELALRLERPAQPRAEIGRRIAEAPGQLHEHPIV